MIYHLVAFTAGALFDLLIGDPNWKYHPICLIGNLIGFLKRRLIGYGNGSSKDKMMGGAILTGLTILITVLVVGTISSLAYYAGPVCGMLVEAVLTYFALASKSLRNESMKVYQALNAGGVIAGRKAVSMIVGRDTENLDEKGVIKATVETIAENTSDGVIAPMIYLLIGGPTLGFMYKAINTMDSMVGYKNEEYIDFGHYPARVDDVANYIPARVSAFLMLAASFISLRFDFANALKIYKRDRFNHASPNSAQTEAVCAGALDVQLAGPAFYFGTYYDKQFIGDKIREIEPEDIKMANKLMYLTVGLCLIICVVILCMAVMFTAAK